MSDLLYQTRLRWTRESGGVAMLHGVRVELPAEVPPALSLDPRPELIAIDYTPEVRVSVIHAPAGRQRDMSMVEVAACDEYLRRVCMKGGVR